MPFSVSIVIRSAGGESLREIFSLLSKQRKIESIKEVVIINTKSNYSVLKTAKNFNNQFSINEIYLPQSEFTYGKALNLGISKTESDIVAFLSGHSVPVNENWISELIAPHNNQDVAGVCGSQISYPPSNCLEKAFRYVWYNCSPISLPLLLELFLEKTFLAPTLSRMLTAVQTVKTVV